MTTFNLNMANCFSPFSKKIKPEKVGNGLHCGAATITLNYVPKYGQIRQSRAQIRPNTVFGAHIWTLQIWSSGVSLKRSCEMQFKEVLVDFLFIGVRI